MVPGKILATRQGVDAQSLQQQSKGMTEDVARHPIFRLHASRPSDRYESAHNLRNF
jgi:hypothetical protein